MNIEIKGKQIFWIIITIFIAALASISTIKVVDYMRDHEDMRQTINDQKQVIQMKDELSGVHESNAERLQENVEQLKAIPVR